MAIAQDRVMSWAEETLREAHIAELPTRTGLRAVRWEKAERQSATRQVPTYHLVELRPTEALIASCVERALRERGEAPDAVFVSVLRYLSVVSQADQFRAHTTSGVILVQLRILSGLGDEEAEAAFAV